ncbi:hypothetical protein BGZ83_005740, partial [Gryganskiella cystojenkinii]
INYLAEELVAKGRAIGTVNNHRSAIMNLVENPGSLWANPLFKDFFKHLSSDEIRDCTNTPVDVTPVLQYFKNLGPNEELADNVLVPKLCWLLAVTGFMRPSDIHRSDLKQSHVLPSGALELKVI